MGYQAELLAAVCEVFLTARAAGALAKNLPATLCGRQVLKLYDVAEGVIKKQAWAKR